ncbi:EF-P 5-aminopentanol modification-associated protein YfmH [Enterococcus dongliensis]|uniref:EF-P 5-aminopentanol modification-associated protein YfmH n=1 Tax=Enterococcus dongliensis TaxID=2559925 RepID=UPI0028905E8B|nr:pitrilysin family protein [Enterococcus dongliensis]MDT2603700.1 pitrilysin family protein [Enterococcus dongliensis]MDT2644918.1 pitrilysin family protein [Enterococcus dongliensis]MDT2667975.1 pitrilysin family protein [Enterococcus dongliensis]MDT2671950.1 pitrilysin family protein [Enterococcus dongliensis]MDT2676106.1 pitrilysin family protein [Enterococcus dongliensis]
MDKVTYQKINETLYKEILPNGLTVYLLPKAGYHKTYGLFSTNYGSIDNEFIPRGGTDYVKVPDGIAHFLEHKMFEKEDGDVFQKFGEQGASANAFTSFTRTSYLFSTTDQLELNLATLIDFVQAPYFTEESVQKEQGIIGQEIQMYQDDPSWQQFFAILKNMYPKHPLHIDIAGTIDSIADITVEDLYTCYNTFYHPSNMTLFVVGKLEPETLMAFIRENQAAKTFDIPEPIQRRFPEETSDEIVKFSKEQMSITVPKAIVGIKGLAELPQDDKQRLIFKISMDLLFQLLLGPTSKNYLHMYNEGLLDDSFGFEFSLDRSFYFADFGGDSEKPERLAERLTEILLQFANDPEVNEKNLALLKKKMLGKYFQSLNSLEYVANQFTQSLFGEWTLFDMPEIIQEIKLTDILAAGELFIHEEAFTRFYMEKDTHTAASN